MACCMGHRCETVLFVILLIFDIFDFISDWLFYYDVTTLEPGLVYGPVEPSKKTALLVFSIVGTVCFLVEYANHLRKRCSPRGKPFLSIYLMSAITTWLEDVPQILVNVSIAVCREEPVSYYQLVKAAASGAVLVIFFIMGIVDYVKFAETCDYDCRNRKAYRIANIVGSVIIMGAVVCIFLLTQTKRNPDGTVSATPPKSLFDDYYDNTEYFANVSIYYQHPSFQNSQSENLWLQLPTLNLIAENTDSTYLFKYEYQDNQGVLHMALTSGKNDRWHSTDCYTFNKHTGSVTSSSCMPSSSTLMTSLIFRFKFKSPVTMLLFKNQILGDIIFNAKVNNTQCTSYEDIVFESAEGRQNNKSVIRYYQAKFIQDSPLVQQNGTWRFYRESGDLRDITEVWKTGWLDCACTGRTSPHLDPQFPLPCS